jgi:hypothetical protein
MPSLSLRSQQKAGECLGKTIEILKECGADGWVNKYRKNWPQFYNEVTPNI